MIFQNSLSAADAQLQFTVASFNLENYLSSANGTRPAKSDRAKAKVRESIRAIDADLLGIQEIGDIHAFDELRLSLRQEGFDYPYWEHVPGYDTNICVAVLSRYPIIARRSHPHEAFLLNGRRFQMSRGIAEVDVKISSEYTLTLMVVHLKSKRRSFEADEEDLREQEALILREKIDARLRSASNLNLVVVGDFNDAKDSRTLRAVLGKGKFALKDTRPAELSCNREANSPAAPRNSTWTHFYAKEDSYSRFDYILMSSGMAHEWNTSQSYVLNLPDWGVASDHRPITASFWAEDR